MNPWLFQGLVIANICGVNLFIMISGYFGINGSVKSFVKLWLMITFYSLICLLVGNLIFGMHIGMADIMKSVIMPFTSHHQYWFLESYLGLYILAPIINKGLKALSIHELKNITLLMTVIAFISCWYGKNTMIGNDGYSFYHFIYIYVLGYFLKHGKIIELSGKTWLMVAILSFILNICITYGFDFLNHSFENRYWNENAQAYNNPFVIMASVSIFMYFSKLKLKPNKYINSVAGAALGCYLLQDGFIRTQMYGMQRNYVESTTSFNAFIMYCISFIAIWGCSYFLINIFSILYKGPDKLILRKLMRQV